MMKKAALLIATLVSALTVSALDVRIIDSQYYGSGHTMDARWRTICQAMGHTATIVPVTTLDNISNFTGVDILIVASGVDGAINLSRADVIKQYLQNGGKVYLQTEYSTTFAPNIAFANIINSLGGYFNWTGTVTGTLNPMNPVGSIATDYAVTSSITNFWYGCAIDPCSTVEMFLKYGSQYFGCIFCVPSSAGRMITASDQDWTFISNGPQCDSLMKNIIFNLAKPSFNCSNSGSIITASLGADTTFCSGNTLVLSPGSGYSGYLWQSGQTTASINVTATGTYWVRVTSACGSTASDTIAVTVTSCVPPVQAALSSTDSSFCANNCISFTDLTINDPTSWKWTFQGAFPPTSTDQNPSGVCYLNGGQFDVKLVVSNAAGSDSITMPMFISVYDAPPTPTITQSNDTLYCSSDPSYVSYQWYANSVLVPGATNPYIVIAADGNYNVSVTDGNGCAIAVGINIVLGTNTFSPQSFVISPNPVHDVLTVFPGKDFSLSDFVIIDMLGRQVTPSVSSMDGSGKTITVDVSSIAAGVYILQVNTPVGVSAKRFVKE